MKIKSITKSTHEPRDIFCLNVEEHKLIIRFPGNKKDYLLGNCNFGLLFGASARTFASASLVPEWSFEEAKDYVHTHKLEEKQVKFFQLLIRDINRNKDITDKALYIEDQRIFSYYWAAADDIRTKFFNTYKGLAEWHKTQHALGKKNGYVQSSWGPIRRVPFLVYTGKDDDGMRTKNYENICLNSPVQNFENCYMMYNMVRVNRDLHRENLSTNLIGNIHDSFIAYLHRSEMPRDKEIFLKHFHEPLPEVMKGIPYEIELGYSDYNKGEFWGIIEHEF